MQEHSQEIILHPPAGLHVLLNLRTVEYSQMKVHAQVQYQRLAGEFGEILGAIHRLQLQDR